MNKESKTGFGNFLVTFEDNGFLRLIKQSDETMELIKKIGDSDGSIYLLGANYSIIEGVLHLEGEFTTCKHLASGDWNDFDYENQEKIDLCIELLHIDPTNVYSKPYTIIRYFNRNQTPADMWSAIKYWFRTKETITKRYIKRGYYLYKKGETRIYKTPFFRIREN